MNLTRAAASRIHDLHTGNLRTAEPIILARIYSVQDESTAKPLDNDKETQDSSPEIFE